MKIPTFTFLSDPMPEQISQITALYRAEGWWTADASDNPEMVAGIIAGSHCFMVATIGDEIIGMGRAISDRASDAYIQDVTVKDAYRDQGIGSEIIKLLVERLQGDGLCWIGLIAERGSHEFYMGLGFEKMPDSTPMLKIIPA
ncbi:GNAT family N-acetyltransferase [Desulfonema magnum]|uniref:GNAT domain-containing protein n=1 Tax=Desulfonema magnum TaxID=45655 RepID=A0A975BM85_9BACT|nr:GNAT family N-acetyltransferase [Desulfonema magnum]QTA87579.1 GNAT domain-containing protein [Desulfonema magnum]